MGDIRYGSAAKERIADVAPPEVEAGMPASLMRIHDLDRTPAEQGWIDLCDAVAAADDDDSDDLLGATCDRLGVPRERLISAAAGALTYTEFVGLFYDKYGRE
jgi:hypothetical protein